MALSGTITKSITGRQYIIEWSASQSIVNNNSIITCVHKLKNDATYSLNIYARSNTCTVDGESKGYTSAAISTSGGSTITLGTTTHTVSHDSNGKKSVTISGTFNIQATLSGSYISSLTASDTVTLDTIPRTSSLSMSTSSVDVGSSITANITRATSSFTHTVEFYINSTYYKQYTNVSTSQTFTIPTSWYSAMPSSDKCTAYCRITTFSGSTQIGGQVTKSFTVTIPSGIKPTLGTIILDPVNITTRDGTSRNVLVKGKNQITVSISGCKAGEGSSIKSYTFEALSGSSVIATSTVTTTETSASATLGAFSHTGSLKFRVTVSDKRSRSTNNNGSEPTCTCYDYRAPYFSSFNAYRANSDGTANINGTHIQCDYTPQYSSVNSTNTITVTAHYNGQTQTDNDGSLCIDLNGDTSTTYNVYLSIVDNYNGTSKTSVVTIFGEARILNITSNGTGIAIGKMAENNELFECRWPAKFDDGLVVGSSTQSTTPTSGIAVHDVRNADITPDSFGDQNANFYFDTISSAEKWYSILHMKGWNGDYAAWELAGNAGYSFDDNTLKYRQGLGNTWGDWQTVLTNKNIGSYALSPSGAAMTGQLYLGANLWQQDQTAGLNCQNSDIVNVNAIYFQDASDSAGEAINFYRSSGHWDTLYAHNGALKFHPNRATDTALGGHTVFHSNNFRTGTCTLYTNGSGTTVNFSSAMTGTPIIMLTPLTNTAGALPAKVLSRSASGFTAIIGGDAIAAGTAVTFMYLALSS